RQLHILYMILFSPETAKWRKGPAQLFEKARFAEGKTLDFASPGLDFPSLRLGFSFPRFVQKENSAAPRNSIRINVNATYVNAVAARPPVRPSGEPDVEGR
ncbi:MAG TPA: hypothetical protein VKA12_01185, partial [Roseiarcus sp.]|nr:hypothetical protein [Roseiarcus sp.]